MPNCCRGFSGTGMRCKLKVKDDIFCHNHMYQRPMPFYARTNESWPYQQEIMYGVKKYRDPEQLLRELYDHLFNSKFLSRRRRVTAFLFAIETIRLNVEICYNHPVCQYLSGLMVANFECIKALHPYLIEFKKKCIRSYREQAQNKINCFYFKHVEGLCPDIIEKITGLV